MKTILSSTTFLAAFVVSIALCRAEYPELSEASMVALDRIRKFTKHEAEYETKFWLYTQKNQEVDQGQLLKINDTALLKSSNFNPSYPVRFLIHGYLNKKHSNFNKNITRAYLKRGNFNVIVVDWGALSKDMPSTSEYNEVAASIHYLSPIVAHFALFLHATGVAFENMYLIGHSLGSHIAGMAGQLIRPHKFPVIFALDPAGPRFTDIDIERRLDKDDAEYVESIQTDIRDVELPGFLDIFSKAFRDLTVYGYYGALGNASFFPNYGGQQPGCLLFGCSHSRAYAYFAESVETSKPFHGRGCKNFHEVLDKGCTEPERQIIMGGEPAQTGRGGIFYVQTGSHYPFRVVEDEPPVDINNID